jgi:hypothetical protein
VLHLALSLPEPPIDGVSLSVSNQGLISFGGRKVRRSPIINLDIRVVAHVNIINLVLQL